MKFTKTKLLRSIIGILVAIFFASTGPKPNAELQMFLGKLFLVMLTIYMCSDTDDKKEEEKPPTI